MKEDLNLKNFPSLDAVIIMKFQLFNENHATSV